MATNLMKIPLSKPTIQILRNFADINQTLRFGPDSTLHSRTPTKHVYVEAKICEEFPKPFTIYNLFPLLSVLGKFESPTLVCGDKFLTLSDGTDSGLSVDYLYGDDSLAYTPDPLKSIRLPSVEVEFTLTTTAFTNLTSVATILTLPYFAVQSDGKTLQLRTFDTNKVMNSSQFRLGEARNAIPFRLSWKISNLKLVPGTYHVAVSKEGISRFTNVDKPVTYHVLLDAKTSQYGAENHE